MGRRTRGIRGSRLGAAWALAVAARGLAASEPAGTPEVAGWKPVGPGEHPRIIFRASDVPGLRRRAETPGGRVVVARCRRLLSESSTLWSAAGHAFLYQMTGEKAEADKAFDMALKALTGTPNPDGRYTWPGNGQFRAGPAMAGLALAYDMAYEGWDAAARRKVAQGIVTNRYLADIVERPAHAPGSHHWGAHSGGAGVALLAVRGDDSVVGFDIEEKLRKLVENVKREIADGYGDHGYYGEGHYAGRISSNTGLLPFLLAYRTAAGVDLVQGSGGARWLSAKWIYDLVRFDGQVRNYQRGMYARDPFTRGEMLSSQGDFALGFGAVPPEWRPALLWTYNHIVEPDPEARDYDVLRYPHWAAYALVHWPSSADERNPGEMFPRVLRDGTFGYYVFRSGWTGTDDDVVVTALLGSGGSRGRSMGRGGTVGVVGRGGRWEAPGMFYLSRETHFQPAVDGSGVLSARMLTNASDVAAADLDDYRRALAVAGTQATSLAVDFSGASGAPVLVAQIGPQAGFQVAYWMEVTPARPIEPVVSPSRPGVTTPRVTAIALGGQRGWVMTLQRGPPPPVQVGDDEVTIGRQSLRFDGEKIILGVMKEAGRPAP